MIAAAEGILSIYITASNMPHLIVLDFLISAAHGFKTPIVFGNEGQDIANFISRIEPNRWVQIVVHLAASQASEARVRSAVDLERRMVGIKGISILGWVIVTRD